MGVMNVDFDHYWTIGLDISFLHIGSLCEPCPLPALTTTANTEAYRESSSKVVLEIQYQCWWSLWTSHNPELLVFVVLWIKHKRTVASCLSYECFHIKTCSVCEMKPVLTNLVEGYIAFFICHCMKILESLLALAVLIKAKKEYQ